MAERAADGDCAVVWGEPAADSGVLQVVAGVPAVLVEHHPAQRGVGQRRSALKCCAGEVGQALERFDAPGGLVEFAVTVLPDSETCGRFESALRFLKLAGELNFLGSGVALQGLLVKESDALLVGAKRLKITATDQVGGLLDDKGD